jgi:hypothetical protein
MKDSFRCSSNSIDSWRCDDLRSTNRRPSDSIDPNLIATIDEDARVAFAPQKWIDDAERYTHNQDCVAPPVNPAQQIVKSRTDLQLQ